MTRTLLFLLLAVAPAVGQAPQSPSSSESGKKATIEGIVISEVSKAPLRGVAIDLHRPRGSGTAMDGENANYSAVTDSSGSFRIEDIEPGEYFLDHHKTGYVNSRAALGISPHSLKLGKGELLKDLHYALVPQAIVSGRVVDDEGEPVQGASVMLLHPSYWHGSVRMMPAGQAQTNDLGEYRIVNVQPGHYYLQADIQRLPGSSEHLASSTAAGAPRVSFVSTYYPNAADASQAIRIEAQAGLETSGQDITLRKEKVVTVSGKVLDVDGSPAKQMFITFVAENGFLPYSNRAYVAGEKGRFSVNNVRPGRYIVMANKMHSQDHPTAQASVTVGDAGVKNVVLQMPPPLDVKGAVVLEGPEGKNFNFSNLAIYANPAGFSPFGGARTQVNSDGTFTLSALSPGRYILGVDTGGHEGYVQSVQSGGQDVYGKALDAAAFASGDLHVVVRLDSAKVAGTVEISEEQKASLRSPAVVLVPAESQLRSEGQFITQQLDRLNSFELANIRPGDYLVFAFEEYDYGALGDPEVFAAVEGNATKISLSRSDSKSVSLKLVPWPEQFADRLQ
jgi:protocatechuate 3,4-dioxygenase beta subunit